MNLVVCPSRLFAIYLLSYVRTFGNGRKFHFVILDSSEPTKEILELAAKYNVVFISNEKKSETKYLELIIHSYSEFHNQQKYISSIDFKILTLYSDGIRNGFYGLPKIDKKLKKLIHFGLFLKETSFEMSIPSGFAELNHEVVELHHIKNTWFDLQQLSENQKGDVFNATDLVIVMRYWGLPDSIYEFKEDLSILDYLKQEISDLHCFNRVIYRSDPRFDHHIDRKDLINIFPNVSEIVFWEDMFGSYGDFSELTAPESVIFNSTDSPGYFFGFDSSLNILVGKEWEKTNIIWPQPENFRPFFKYSRSCQHVEEQTTWMKTFNERGSNNILFEPNVSGHAIEQHLTEMNLKLYELERDALVQERDALVQERDALVQERDALNESTRVSLDRLSKEISLIKDSNAYKLARRLLRVFHLLHKGKTGRKLQYADVRGFLDLYRQQQFNSLRLRNLVSNETFLLKYVNRPTSRSDWKSEVISEKRFLESNFFLWMDLLRDPPRLHSKQFQNYAIMEAANSILDLGKNGVKAIGFGVGVEPIPAGLAKLGYKVLATDFLEGDIALDWKNSNQLLSSPEDLNSRGILTENEFINQIKFMSMDMNNIPEELNNEFDFVWSSCALGHIGGYQNGLDFIHRSVKLLKPGGIALHTTELDVSSEDSKFDFPTLSLYRESDIKALLDTLKSEGYLVEHFRIDHKWKGKSERFIAREPWGDQPHIRIEVLGREVLSLAIRIERPC